MGLWLVGRRPVLSKRGYSNSPDPNAAFTFRALHDSASVASWHLTYELFVVADRFSFRCFPDRKIIEDNSVARCHHPASNDKALGS